MLVRVRVRVRVRARARVRVRVRARVRVSPYRATRMAENVLFAPHHQIADVGQNMLHPRSVPRCAVALRSPYRYPNMGMYVYFFRD